MDALFLKIEEAETRFDDATAISDAIVTLSKDNPAVAVLIKEFGDAKVDAEIQWRAIEQMPEFKAKYHDRDSARADFLRVAFAKK